MLSRILLILSLVLGLGGALPAAEELAATLVKATGQGQGRPACGAAGDYKAGTLLKAAAASSPKRPVWPFCSWRTGPRSTWAPTPI